MKQCLIAGLSDAGKSTYLAALTYLLKKPVNGQLLIMDETPEDFAYINKLIQPWLTFEKMGRTTRGIINKIEFKICSRANDEVLTVSLPDIAGEDYGQLLKKNSNILESWSNLPDSLLFFINNLNSEVLKEEAYEKNGIDVPDWTQAPPLFTLNTMSVVVQNVMLLKELHKLFHWKKIAIGLSSWDIYDGNYNSPVQMLREKSPFLYNYLMHYFPNAYIFGVSAQGGEYENSEDLQLIDKTRLGERAFIVDHNGNRCYDLTLPLNYLISE